PVPLTTRVTSGLPAGAESGLMLVMRGAGLFTVSVAAFDMPPPGAGLKTVIDSAPAIAMSVAGIFTASEVAETRSVWRFCPLTLTTYPCEKPDPFTTSTNPGPPARTVSGLIVSMRGTGLRARTSSGKAFDTPPPGAGLTACTFNVAGVAISDPGIVVLN